MRDDYEEFAAKGIKTFGVNPASVEKHRAYAEKKGFQYPLLSDPGLVVATAYGAVKPGGRGIARCVVVVEKDGVVMYSKAGLPSNEEILAAI